MKHVFLSRFLRDRRANIAITTAIAGPVIIGFAGLGVETGFWYFLNRKAQSAVDVSAFAAALEKRDGQTDAYAKSVGEGEAARLGFVVDGTTAVTMNLPPTSGAFQNPRAVEMIINYRAPRIFSQLFSSDPVTQTVRAVAAFQEPGRACLLALDTAASGALTFSGASSIELTDCEVMSNSIAPDAVSLGGSTNVLTQCINSVGGIDYGGGGASVTLTTCDEPRTEIGRAKDPYDDVVPPSTARPCRNLNNGGGNTGVQTILPDADGVRRFCNGLNLNGDYVFAPGTYIVEGDFDIRGNSVVAGTDVFFYLTDGAELNFNGNATVNLVAPSLGPYAGILFYGDPADTEAQHVLNGTLNSGLTGAIYTPSSMITLSGNFSGIDGCLQLVGGTVEITGSAAFSSDCSMFGIRFAEVPGSVTLVE